MPRAKTVIAPALFLLTASLAAADFDGVSALEYTRRIVSIGPRTSGSTGMKKQQALILAELKRCGCEVIEDAFVAKTPAGAIPMKNLIARFKGTSGRALAVSGHYDTKRFSGFTFVGANDGGSSAGFLLEMARALRGVPRKDDIYLIWFDGEEAIREWTANDSLYGSRHLAEKWAADGTLARLKALINVDMIGDKDLHIVQESYSPEGLRRLIWQVAREKSKAAHFSDQEGAIEDDHVPFLRKGVRAIDLIDFEYGPSHEWWHSAQDTMDKLSAGSFQAVGTVVQETLRRLEQQ